MTALNDNVYRRSEVPNELSIFQWSFRRMFEKKACVVTVADA